MAGHLCSSPHRDHVCVHAGRRPCRHGDAAACRCCIYADDDADDSEDSRRGGRAKPLLAPDTDTQTDGETDPDRPPLSPPDCSLATHRLLMTSSDPPPAATSDVMAACRAAELAVA